MILLTSSQCKCAGSQQQLDAATECRQEIALKPSIALEPVRIACRGVRQRQIFWREFAPGLYRLRQGTLAAILEKVILRILTKQEGQFDAREFGEQMIEPS